MKLPTLLAVDDSQKNEVILTIDMSPELAAFSGHFPNNPILPGVVQIDWAVRFAAIHFGIKEISARDFQVKFRNIIRPGEPLALTFKLDCSKNRLSFTYQSGDALMSSGQLKLETAL
jgi:3-hydroxymyristoyl/3-hydroxydecanoyl-(acyl carrier protein) dehydratase